jgi:hypothetical protein
MSLYSEARDWRLFAPLTIFPDYASRALMCVALRACHCRRSARSTSSPPMGILQPNHDLPQLFNLIALRADSFYL